jgi:hypothetical protein
MKIEKYINDFYNKNIKNREFIIIIILIFVLALGKQIFIIIRFIAVWLLIYLITMRLTDDSQKSLITATLLTLILYILGNLYEKVNIFEGFDTNSELKEKTKDMPMDKNEMNDEITKLLGLKELSGENDREDDNESSEGGSKNDDDSDFDNVSDVSSDSESESEIEESEFRGKKKKNAIMSKKRVQRETFSLMKQIQNTLKDMAPQIKQGGKLMKDFEKLKLDDIELPKMDDITKLKLKI